MLRIHKRRNAALLLDLRDRVQSDRRFTRRFRPVNFDDPAARQSADPERNVQRKASRGDDFNVRVARFVAELHDRALAVVLFNTRKDLIQCPEFIVVHSETSLNYYYSPAASGVSYTICLYSRNSA